MNRLCQLCQNRDKVTEHTRCIYLYVLVYTCSILDVLGKGCPSYLIFFCVCSAVESQDPSTHLSRVLLWVLASEYHWRLGIWHKVNKKGAINQGTNICWYWWPVLYLCSKLQFCSNIVACFIIFHFSSLDCCSKFCKFNFHDAHFAKRAFLQ